VAVRRGGEPARGRRRQLQRLLRAGDGDRDGRRHLRSHPRARWAYPGVPAWVFTHREFETPAGADVRYAQGSVADHIADLRAAAGDGVLWVIGGGELASQFVEAGELDEVIVSYVPCVLGTGIGLFARPIPGTLELTSSEQLPQGMVQNSYAVRTPSR
jgi:dihydrofolate reductase